MNTPIKPVKCLTTHDAELVESILALDMLIETRLAALEQLLESRGDAALELEQLRELRQTCAGLKALIRSTENVRTARATAS